MKLSVVLLIGMLLVAFSAWQSQSGVNSWAGLIVLDKFASLVGVLGSVIVTWLSRSPIGNNKGK